MSVEYTHDEYCIIRLTLTAGTSRTVAAAPAYSLRYSYRRPPDADVFVQLERHVREIGSVTLTELENTRRTRILVTPDNEGTIIAVVGRNLWRSSRDFARKSVLPQSIRRSAHLISDYHLLRTPWFKQATGELFLTYNSADNRCTCQVSQQSRLSMRYCYAIRKRGCKVCFRVYFWADVAGNIAFRLYTIPDGPTAYRYLNFATNVVPVLLVEVLLSVRQVLRFQYDGTEARCG